MTLHGGTPFTCHVHAAQILLQFLLDYPVGEKRLDSHLQFLLANLAYEHETGRLAVRALQSIWRSLALILFDLTDLT